MNKREFMWAAGSGALAGCGGPALAAEVTTGASAQRAPASLSTLAGWRARIGERFDVFGGGAGSAIELRNVQAHEAASGTEQFTLVFSVTGVALGVGTRVLRQPGQAPLALFLEQAGQAASGAELLRADCCHLA
jgi:hypothetical protein